MDMGLLFFQTLWALILPLVTGLCDTRAPTSKVVCHCKNQEYCKNYLIYDSCGNDGCEARWNGDLCHRLNVVYGLTGRDNLGSVGGYDESNQPEYAVDGKLSTFYGSPFVQSPYLWLNTGEVNTVYAMKISTSGILKDFEIDVSNSTNFTDSQRCYKHPTTPSVEEYNIKCNQPLIGQYVRVLLPRQTYLYIQKFEIYRCDDYWFGELCNEPCNCQNSTEVCNKITGRCESGCAPGYSGTDCQGRSSGKVTHLRLVGGNVTSSTFSGRLEVFHSKWGTVCYHNFDDNAALVVCRNLGYRDGVFLSSSPFNQGTGPILLDNVICSGDEADISDCQHNPWGNSYCSHSMDVGVICFYPQITGGESPEEATSEVVTPLRLIGGKVTRATLSGRVEVFHNSVWGTVCDDNFDNNAARVVCRNLGYRGGTFSCCSHFGSGTGQIWLDDVGCTGGETDISNCQHNHWATHNCGHNEDVGVICSDPQVITRGNITEKTGADITPLRLVDGIITKNTFSGRLEVFHNGTWGTVCDDGFDDRDARVVCWSLGYRGGTFSCCGYFGLGMGQILLDDVSCTGVETDISNCQHSHWGTHNCQHSEDVGVICSEQEET